MIRREVRGPAPAAAARGPRSFRARSRDGCGRGGPSRSSTPPCIGRTARGRRSGRRRPGRPSRARAGRRCGRRARRSRAASPRPAAPAPVRTRVTHGTRYARRSRVSSSSPAPGMKPSARAFSPYSLDSSARVVRLELARHQAPRVVDDADRRLHDEPRRVVRVARSEREGVAHRHRAGDGERVDVAQDADALRERQRIAAPRGASGNRRRRTAPGSSPSRRRWRGPRTDTRPSERASCRTVRSGARRRARPRPPDAPRAQTGICQLSARRAGRADGKEALLREREPRRRCPRRTRAETSTQRHARLVEEASRTPSRRRAGSRTRSRRGSPSTVALPKRCACDVVADALAERLGADPRLEHRQMTAAPF